MKDMKDIIEALQDKDDRTAGILQKSVPAFSLRHSTWHPFFTLQHLTDN